MPTALVCPLCQNRKVVFCGMKACLLMRSTCEWVAVFLCDNSHFFSILLSDAAQELGMENFRATKFGNIQKSIIRARNKKETAQLRRNRLPPPLPPLEPAGWLELKRMAQCERDPEKFARIIDRMNLLLRANESREAEIHPISTS